MNIFTKIFKRNLKAKSIPLFLNDYKSITSGLIQRDETSFACIDKIATAFASLSYGIYDKKTKQSVKHNLLDVLREPNLDETHSLFFYQLIQDYYAGNIYLYKYNDQDGNLISLFRLNPNAVVVSRDDYNRKIYSYYGQRYTSDKILHIPSRFGYDGKIGHSIFDECRKTFDTAHNLEAYTKNTFDNSLGKRLVIDLSNALPNASEDEQQQIRERYIQNYAGSENAGKPVVKTGKIDFTTLDSGVSDNRSAQLAENRQYQQEIIAQIFNVPVEYLTGRSTTDIETLTTLFMTQAIQPLVKVFEENFEKLLSPEDRERYYIEFNYNSIMKTSLAAKIDSYTKQLMNGVLTPNEIRAKENLPPIEAGDYTFIPANLMPLTKDNVEAYMATAKSHLTVQEKADIAGTNQGVGSDKQ